MENEITAVRRRFRRAMTFSLAQNYPNPFNPTTVIRFQLPSAGVVRLSIHDLLGREVALLVNGKKGAGRHEVTFDGRSLPSGMYICRLAAGNHAESRKMVLAR